MIPLALGLGLGMGALGAYRGKKQADRQAEVESDSRRQRAAQIRYSPWTGRQSFSDIQYAGSGATDAMLGGALQGGMSGAAFGQGLSSMSAGADTAAKTAGGQSYLGGNQMSADLGKSSFNTSTMPTAGGMGEAPMAGASMGAAPGGYLGGGQSLADPNNPYMQQQAPSLYGASLWPRMAGR